MEATYETELDALRMEITGVLDEISWTSNAPLPKDEVKQRLTHTARQLAEKFDMNLARLARPDAGPQELREILTVHERVTVNAAPGVSALRIELGGFLFATLGEDLIKRLHKQIDALDYVAGPPMKERPARLAALRDTLRSLERREEDLICQADASGVYLARRPDADPEIVLSFDPSGQIDELRLSGRIHPGVFVPPPAQ